jgi:hydrogenase maturation protease
MTSTRLAVGIGSHHGDDQVGWRVAEELARHGPAEVSVRLARAPADLLDWLPADSLILCDGCRGSGPVGCVRGWSWPDAPPSDGLRWSGTHQFGLGEVLLLADRMGLLPSRIAIWTVEVDSVVPGAPLSAQVAAAVPVVVAAMQHELTRQDGPSLIAQHA